MERIAQQEEKILIANDVNRTTRSGANLYPPGVWFANVMTFFSGVTFVLFFFVFAPMLSLKPRPFVQSSFDM